VYPAQCSARRLQKSYTISRQERYRRELIPDRNTGSRGLSTHQAEAETFGPGLLCDALILTYHLNKDRIRPV
jgi:hypothetical protein